MVFETGFAVGAAVLFGALVYGVRQYERRDPRNETLTEAGTREVYAQEQAHEEGRQ